MASPTPKPGSKPRPKPSSEATKVSNSTSRRQSVSHEPPQVVDPIWLLKAIGLVVIAALVCGYLTLCLLFYQGQWQLVLHPSRATPAPATIAGIPYETVHFGVDEAAVPQLAGWWIPAAPTARYSRYTALYLPSGDGSLATAIPTLSSLHEIGINVFAFDYRGYGQSAPTHPNQRRMTEDAASAWQYLTVSRALPSSKLVIFGDGVGAALAAGLAASHPEVPAIVIQSPRPDVIQVVLADPRTESLPVHLLFRDRFEITAPLSTLKTAKLLSLSDPVSKSIEQTATAAAEPKMVSTIPASQFNGPVYKEQLVRFFDQYLR